MKIKGDFVAGHLIKRLNRFVLQVDINGRTENAHLRDPGRLKELMIRNSKVLLRARTNPGKTKYEVIAIRSAQMWVVVNSSFHSNLAEDLIKDRYISGLKDCNVVKREVKLGRSRIDFLLDCNGMPYYLEVKGCTLVENGYGLFPDAPTERGTRHVHELTNAIDKGYKAGILFVVMRIDANMVIPNFKTDINFVKAVKNAKEHGVEFYAYSFFFDGSIIYPFRELKVVV